MILDCSLTLVTGATGGGVGSEIVKMILDRDGSVCLHGRTEQSTMEYLRKLAHDGYDLDSVVPVWADLGCPIEVEALAFKLSSLPIDSFVHNASEGGIAKSLHELEWAHWQRELQINLTSAFVICKNILPFMVEKSFGRIVFLSSSAAKRGARGRNAAYSASKAALIGLTKQLALEYGRNGILVNCVAPSQIDTLRARENNRRTDQDFILRGKEIPLGRVAKPSDIAPFCIWLASNQNTYLTGQSIDLDGGSSLSPSSSTLTK